MLFREAQITDVAQLQRVRLAVRENQLSDPSKVKDEDVVEYLTQKGAGWVCAAENEIVRFAIADLEGASIWALFVHPDYEKQGIGKTLHQIMLDWYFSKTIKTVWLSTAAETRAAVFYGNVSEITFWIWSAGFAC
ncbi:MAG: GNAT family N-acetyltransferase [Lewinellaceae bacterium]|nr:GNAT family N-acetyltransferase [Lewinellaceae bacterium]